MHANEQLIHKFYEAFAQNDFNAMSECYHSKANFKDEAFDLKIVNKLGQCGEC